MLKPVAVTVAFAHHVIARYVVNTKFDCPLLLVVPLPDAIGVPVHVDPGYTLIATLAPPIGAPVLDATAMTDRGTLYWKNFRDNLPAVTVTVIADTVMTVTDADWDTPPSVAVTEPLPGLEPVKTVDAPLAGDTVPGAVVVHTAFETSTALPY